MHVYDAVQAGKTSERMKEQWQDSAYRAHMVEVTKNRKRCRDCKHLGPQRSERWVPCLLIRSRDYLTGGEFACGKFEEKDEKV